MMAVTRRPIAGLSPTPDPAVEHHLSAADDPLLSGLAQRRAARNQTKGQRKKAERDRKRNKVTFDLPEYQSAFIERISAEHECPPSHVAALLLEYAIEHWSRIDIESRKVRTRNLRFEWFLDVE